MGTRKRRSIHQTKSLGWNAGSRRCYGRCTFGTNSIWSSIGNAYRTGMPGMNLIKSEKKSFFYHFTQSHIITSCISGRPHQNSFAFRYSGTSGWRTMDTTAGRCGRIQFGIEGQCQFFRVHFLKSQIVLFNLRIWNDSHSLKLDAIKN